MRRSAEFHSAVSRTFSPHCFWRFGRDGRGQPGADCKSAIQQTECLRYEEGARLEVTWPSAEKNGRPEVVKIAQVATIPRNQKMSLL